MKKSTRTILWILGGIFVLPVIATLVFVAIFGETALDTQPQVPDPDTVEAEEVSLSPECREAFQDAHNVSVYRDLPEHTFPMYFACTSLDEWREANDLYPDALDVNDYNSDPVEKARMVCHVGFADELAGAAICDLLEPPQY